MIAFTPLISFLVSMIIDVFETRMKVIHIFLALLPLIVVLGVSVVVNYRIGFFYWGESGKYIVHYLEDKPMLTKLFDYYQHDAGAYRPRELGNVFNMIDAYFLLLFVAAGMTNFLSPVHFLSMFFIASTPIFLAFKKKAQTIFFVPTAVLLGMLFLTAPQPFMTTYYFRTSKSVVSLFIALYILVLTFGKQRILAGVFIFLLTLAMGITDEIGIFMSGVFFLYLLLQLIVSSRKQMYFLYMNFAALGMLGMFVYREIISPMITTYVLGESPRMWEEGMFQALNIAAFPAAAELLLSYVGYLTGGIRGVFVLPFLFIVGFVLTNEVYHRKKFFAFVSIGLTLIVIGIFSVAVLFMMHAHGVIVWKELRLVYYPLPFVTLWFFIVLLACFACIQRYKKSFYIIVGSILLALSINVMRLPEYQKQYLTWWKVDEFVGAAFPLIANIDKKIVHERDIQSIDGRDVIYVMRKRLGREISR